MKITKPFSSIFNGFDECIQINRKYESFDNGKLIKVFLELKYREILIPNYENINEHPELKIFLSKPQPHSNLKIYDHDYHLDVWYGQAYVISLNNKVTAFHIDETKSLQEGDSNTFVWNFNNNFVVYNDEDVYSVILIVKKLNSNII